MATNLICWAAAAVNAVCEACDASTEVIDGAGMAIVPGLVDSHQHPFRGTVETLGVDLSDVHSVEEVLGTYVSAEAHAGAVKSAKAQVMTKGEVSLALSGKGRGWDLGVAFGKLTISRQ